MIYVSSLDNTAARRCHAWPHAITHGHSKARGSVPAFYNADEARRLEFRDLPIVTHKAAFISFTDRGQSQHGEPDLMPSISVTQIPRASPTTRQSIEKEVEASLSKMLDKRASIARLLARQNSACFFEKAHDAASHMLSLTPALARGE